MVQHTVTCNDGVTIFYRNYAYLTFVDEVVIIVWNTRDLEEVLSRA